jgi:hypothetical protein
MPPVFALLFIFLALAALFGCLVFIAACVLTFSSKRRGLGVTSLCWGLVGAAGVFASFAFLALFVEHGREPLASQFSGVLSAAGFGAGGAIGAFLYVLRRGLRIPNRWSDRRRATPVA